MSFTQDELQSFNTILEQRLSAQRRELERTFEQRLNLLRRDFEQRLAAFQQDLMRHLPRSLSKQQSRLLQQRSGAFGAQQSHMSKSSNQDVGQEQQQQLEGTIARALAAQLLAIEQLINQRISHRTSHLTSDALIEELPPDFEDIEVQTEIAWDDLVEVVDKAVGERLSTLEESVRSSVRDAENYLSTQLHSLREDIHHWQEQAYNGKVANIQEVCTSIEQLEHIVESMQVAMTANNALFSNRLYHHQQLPAERAHTSNHPASSQVSHVGGKNNQLPSPREREGE